jgi:hypothetical protein
MNNKYYNIIIIATIILGSYSCNYLNNNSYEKLKENQVSNLTTEYTILDSLMKEEFKSLTLEFANIYSVTGVYPENYFDNITTIESSAIFFISYLNDCIIEIESKNNSKYFNSNSFNKAYDKYLKECKILKYDDLYINQLDMFVELNISFWDKKISYSEVNIYTLRNIVCIGLVKRFNKYHFNIINK